ncbi:hypothetical protein IHE45_01G097300 [Dioscorea alata]|uniref:Uncharacterized protein n=1 Tax=Dioscorea alata TaxID=55571 RepID=A0ACB7WWR6_DIOAL|nr:hypothetical protein IHE45_01G097300 [Dioscorea alata]
MVQTECRWISGRGERGDAFVDRLLWPLLSLIRSSRLVPLKRGFDSN